MKIKFLVLDVDGTLTDGKIYVGYEGEIFKSFDTKDGCGIKDLLPQKAIIPVVITGRESKIVSKRCSELGIKYVFQGEHNKLHCLINFISDYNMTNKTTYNFKDVAFMGDDLPDLECIKYIKTNGGYAACPADAVDSVKENCDFISTKNGGNGAVREFIESILQMFDK